MDRLNSKRSMKLFALKLLAVWAFGLPTQRSSSRLTDASLCCALGDSTRVVDRDGGVRRVQLRRFLPRHGAFPRLKYEPTEGNYLNKMAYLVARESSDAFGDRIALFDSVLLDWALGNCDNHLKNRSLLWSSDWMSKGLSPLYDITCTTFYPEMDREMGVSLCASRKIHEDK